jgi:hypothetical protein
MLPPPRSAVQARINWFRGMAGVPDGVSFDANWNGQNQQTALMMSANRNLSHTPPTNWLCYTAAGGDSAGKSNICYLSGFGNVDPGCVAGYIRDTGDNNQAVGTAAGFCTRKLPPWPAAMCPNPASTDGLTLSG